MKVLLGHEQAKLTDLLKPYGKSIFFRKMEWTDNGVEKLDSDKFPPSQYQSLKDNGFWGAFMKPEEVGDDMLFREWPALLALVKNSLADADKFV